MRRKCASAPVAQPPLLAPTVLKVDGDLPVAATGIRARTMEQREANNRPNAHHWNKRGSLEVVAIRAFRGRGAGSVCAGAVRRLPVTSVGTGLSAGAGVAIC